MKRTFLVVTLAGLITHFHGSLTPLYADLNAGLVAYFPFNGNANDATGNGWNGTPVGGPTIVNGIVGQAYYFDGVNDRISLPGSFLNSGLPQGTLCCWMRADSFHATYGRTIFNRGIAASSTALSLGVTWPPKLNAYINNGGPVTAISILPTNQFIHVAFTWNGSRAKFYINGTIDGDLPFPYSVPSASSRTVDIGVDDQNVGWFHGIIDDVRIYNRALSASEVQQLYLIGGGNVPAVANVRASQQPGTKLVNLSYDVVDGDSSRLNVTVAVSTNNGTSYNLPTTSFSGTGYGASVTPGNNRQIVWNAGTEWNNKQSSQVRFRVTASDGSGSSSAESAAITVDTRDGNWPVVQKVKSAYCDGMKHAYFLNGVSLPLEFEVVPNWNGRTPGSIKFIGPWGTHTQSGTQTKRTYNVGTDFGVGNHLTVKLVAADGTESLPQQVNFDVINPPSHVSALQLSLKAPSSSLQYWNHNPAFTLLALESSPVTVGIPVFGGKKLSFVPEFERDILIKGDGTSEEALSIAAAGDGAMKGISLFGVKVKPKKTVSYGVAGRIEEVFAQGTGWKLSSGTLGVELGAGIRTPDFQFGTTPFYGSLSLDVDTGVYLTAAGLDTSEVTWTGNWECAVKAGGAVGAGVGYGAGVELWGKGGPFWTVEFWPWPPSGFTEIGLTLEIGLREKIRGLFEFEQTIFTYEWPRQPGALEAWYAAALRQLNEPDPSQWKLVSRDYLSASTPYSVFLKKEPVFLRWGDPVVAQMPLVLQTNVFPYSEPSLSVSGTNRLLLLVADNTNRAPENRTEVIWSKWNGSTWVNPTSVWNDATADFSPTVKLLPNGSALAVWENEKIILTNGATLDAALMGLEIATARFEPINQLWVAANLTSNEYVDRSPQLAAATNGKALLTWIQNTNNSLFGRTNALNVVQARVWDGASWQSAGTIGPDPGMLLWSTVAYDGTNGVFLATIDPDDDQSTIGDQELWGATFDGASWTALARLTTNSVQDTKPQAVYDNSGRLVVVWYQDTNLVTRIGDLNLGSPAVVGQLSGASSQKDFHLVTGPARQVSMVWEDLSADGAGPDPMLLNYDAVLGAWSQPLRLLANSNQLERSFSGAYTDNGALLLAYNRVDVTPDTNGVPQFGAVDLMFLDYSIGNDLAVSTGDISLSTNNPAPGQSVDLAAVVRNTGELAATNVPVVFFDGNPASGGSLIGSTQTVAGVFPAGSNATVKVTWIVPQTTTNLTLYVVVDPARARPDRNRANNTATRSVLAADLQISDSTVLQPSATNRIINARCVNTGVIPSGSAVDVVFRRWTTNGPVLATVPIANLPTNGVYDASFEWNLSGVTFTNAFDLVYVAVDAGNLVSEANDDNNQRIVLVMTSLDSDSDGLLDGEEARYGTNPQSPDSDEDGLNDGAEVNLHHTNPVLKDTDGDGMSDGTEIAAGTDPNNALSVFKITNVLRNPDGSVTLQWQSVTNKLYRLNRSLTPSRSSYTTLTNGIPGIPPVNAFTDKTATNSAAFYWIEME